MITVNGQLVSADDPRLEVMDRSKKDNFGVFETMRTYGKEIFRFEEHMERLQRSAEIVGMKLPASLEEIQGMIRVEEFPARVKVVCTPEDVIVEVERLEIEKAVYEGVEVVFLEIERAKPEAKAFPYFVSYEAHDYAVSKGAYEAIFVDREWFVTEGAYSNVFWVKDGKVFTREKGVLPGITREVVMELVPVKFGKITPEELMGMDEIFISKTTTGVVPVGKPGPIAKKLMQHFSNVNSEIK